MPKPFPWFCSQCQKASIAPRPQRYEAKQKHDGRLHLIVIGDLPVPTCNECGRRVFAGDVLSQITIDTYRQLGLLTPDEIRSKRELLGLTQQQMQAMLGLGGNTMSRWEQGHVYQSRALDRMMRLFFASQQVRQMLEALPSPVAEAALH